MSSFDVYLPSSTPGFYNTTGSYTVYLPHTIKFNSTWEVALTNIIFPHSWPTLTSKTTFTIDWKSGDVTSLPLPSRSISNPQELDDVIKETIDEYCAKCAKTVPSNDKEAKLLQERSKLNEYLSITFNARVSKFVTNINKDYISRLRFTEHLAYTLGYLDYPLTSPQTQATYPPDVSGGTSMMYVYAPNLIEPIRVGNSMSPLLRAFACTGKVDNLEEKSFLDAQYRPLITNEINQIKIDLCDTTGNIIPFAHGSVLIVLNFRKKLY